MKAVVFDMDGVLFDTERLCFESWVEIAKQYQIPDMEEVFPLCIGRNRTDTETVIRAHYGQDFPYDQFRQDASDCFWKVVEEKGLPIKKGVYELLAYLKEQGYAVGLASSTVRSSVIDHLERAQIREYFREVVGGDMVVHSKPNPEIYLIACEKLGTDPAQTYAIEDSPNGIRSAHAAGMIPIMVPDMLEPDEELRQLSRVICDDLLAVKDWLSKQENYQS